MSLDTDWAVTDEFSAKSQARINQAEKDEPFRLVHFSGYSDLTRLSRSFMFKNTTFGENGTPLTTGVINDVFFINHENISTLNVYYIAEKGREDFTRGLVEYRARTNNDDSWFARDNALRNPDGTKSQAAMDFELPLNNSFIAQCQKQNATFLLFTDIAPFRSMRKYLGLSGAKYAPASEAVYRMPNF